MTAEEFAVFHHEGQMYGDRTYDAHLMDVVTHVVYMISSLNFYSEMRIGIAVFNDATVKQLIDAAWLHDVIEDTSVTEHCLRELFDETTVDIVVALTKQRGTSYEKYIANIKKNNLACLVKIADTKANLIQSRRSGDDKRIAKYTKQLRLLRGEE